MFENFRTMCLKAYQLDPVHYFTAPGLSWDAALKHSKIELDLITDIDMLLFIERGIKGGITHASKRFGKANSKFIKTGYDSTKEETHLIYLDVNNLYG